MLEERGGNNFSYKKEKVYFISFQGFNLLEHQL